MSEELKSQPLKAAERFLGCEIDICVQHHDFFGADNHEAAAFAAMPRDDETGAEVTFVGRVRGTEKSTGNDGTAPAATKAAKRLRYLELEHYPAMTKSALLKISRDAVERWSPLSIRIVHRVGKLGVGEPIVLVTVFSQHRKSAFKACEYVMDFLKMDAPFWKKAIYTDASSQWIEQRARDQDALKEWQ